MSATREARHFDEELASLRARLIAMAGAAEELLHTSVEALEELDVAKAEAVILGDRELDALEVELDETCIHLLARQQPFARDLRLITMTLRISNDLERVGDHAVNIAQQVKVLAAQPPLGRFGEVGEMARIAGEMLSAALDAFVGGDALAAREVCKRDDLVDSLDDALFRTLLTHMMEDPRRITSAMALILVSRNLERIADLATNVGEDVVYLVEGRSIKHGADRTSAS